MKGKIGQIGQSQESQLLVSISKQIARLTQVLGGGSAPTTTTTTTL